MRLLLALILVAGLAHSASAVTMGCDPSTVVAARNPFIHVLPPQIGRLYLPQAYWDWMVGAGEEFGVDPYLVCAFAAIESRFDAQATSGLGTCRGLMQLHIDVARQLGVDPDDPRENIRGGAQILARLMRRYSGDLRRVCRRYNATSTRAYEREIVKAYRQAKATVGKP